MHLEHTSDLMSRVWINSVLLPRNMLFNFVAQYIGPVTKQPPEITQQQCKMCHNLCVVGE